VSFHPTIGLEAFILSTLSTPMPSHDITMEFTPSLRETLSVIETLRGLSYASSTSSSHFGSSGHVLCTPFLVHAPPFELTPSFDVSSIAISFELDPLEYFSIPCAPCISGIVSNADQSSTMIDSSQKLRGPNMRAIYQRVRPPQSRKCSLESSLNIIIDLLAHRDQ
jgi:hypothetical protein